MVALHEVLTKLAAGSVAAAVAVAEALRVETYKKVKIMSENPRVVVIFLVLCVIRI